MAVGLQTEINVTGAIPAGLSVSLFTQAMPAYTTISWEFAKHHRSGLVSRFYAALIEQHISFDRVFPWGCEPTMTLEEIVAWNQTKLDLDFTLGYKQDVSHDYRQILIRVTPFSECRVFLINLSTRIEFHCIVPQHEITTKNCEPLLLGCLRTWSRLPVLAIETYGEIDSNIGSTAINSGEPPSASLFAIVNQDCSKHGKHREFDRMPLERGCLLKRRRA